MNSVRGINQQTQFWTRRTAPSSSSNNRVDLLVRQFTSITGVQTTNRTPEGQTQVKTSDYLYKWGPWTKEAKLDAAYLVQITETRVKWEWSTAALLEAGAALVIVMRSQSGKFQVDWILEKSN